MEHSGQPTWDIDESTRLAKLLPRLGVDVLDVSSGGNHPDQRIEMHNAFQTDLAGRIRAAVRAEGLELAIAAVGRITDAERARSLVQEGGSKNGSAERNGTVEVEGEHGQVAKAELVLAARQFLRDPHFVLNAAHELNVAVKWANQYERAQPKLKNRL
jgi:2,4-dienoyl-CoA reductase-like NADH-dependent reductase (Old Yellow Enzyme family)